MAKKTKILIIGLILTGTLAGGIVNAQGLVHCGGEGQDPCTLCDFFVLIDNIIDFVLLRLAPPIALLMLIIGGGMFMLAAGDPQKVTTGRKIITSVLIGLVIIYGSYFFVGLILQRIGLAEWIEPYYESWWNEGAFTIPCD
jgi:hypothetical protein